MNSALLSLRCISIVVIAVVVSVNFLRAEMQEVTWKNIQQSGQVPAKLGKKLDAFFKEHPAIFRLFTDLKSPKKGGCKGRLGDVQKEQDFEKLEAANSSPLLHPLIEAELKSLSYNNLVIPLGKKGIPYVIIGSYQRYPVSVMTVSRHINTNIFENRIKECGLTHIRLPKTYLYHLPGKPYGPEDGNWIVVQDYIQGMSPNEFRNHVIWMQALYDAFYQVVFQDEKNEALQEGKKYIETLLKDLAAPEVRKKAIYQHEMGQLDKEQVQLSIQSLKELKRYVQIMRKHLPDSLIHKKETGFVGATNIICIEDKGRYDFYLIDLCLPIGNDPATDARIMKEFTGELTNLPVYDYIHSMYGISPQDDLHHLTHLTDVEKGRDQLLNLSDRFAYTMCDKSLDVQQRWLKKETDRIMQLIHLPDSKTGNDNHLKSFIQKGMEQIK